LRARVRSNNFIVDIGTNIGAFRELREPVFEHGGAAGQHRDRRPGACAAGALFEIEAIVALPA